MSEEIYWLTNLKDVMNIKNNVFDIPHWGII
jgi:hypothetical protein